MDVVTSKNREISKGKFILRKYSKYLKYILYLVFLCLAVIVLPRISIFNIERVDIKNHEYKKTEYITQEFKRELKDQLVGKSYFSITSETISDITGKNPYVKSFWIEKTLLDKVQVNIVERVPVYLIKEKGGKCGVIDSDAYTLEVLENEEACTEYQSKMNLISVDVAPFPILTPNTQSSFYYTYSINDITKILEKYGYEPDRFSIKDGVCQIQLEDKKIVVISFNQELKKQLARFVVIAEEIKNKNIKFSLLDLRYERPVIKVE
ncbi:FtsQ-type POTRA domain-containing protein [Candidatus Dojkabacteria bacterium]|nr:FtsQ-type POTRA domain-containing protein [Candidatus Dojkabacteria bacterium]